MYVLTLINYYCYECYFVLSKDIIQLHIFRNSVKARLLNIPYEKENCCIIVYVHKYFTTRETILLRSQHS